MPYFENVIPGKELDLKQTSVICEKFIRNFVDERKRHLPFWFSMELNCVDHGVFQKNEFKNIGNIFLMVGKGKKIIKTKSDVVADFFSVQKNHEDFDFYVFDDSLNWCLVSTSRLAKNAKSETDFLTIRVGRLPFDN